MRIRLSELDSIHTIQNEVKQLAQTIVSKDLAFYVKEVHLEDEEGDAVGKITVDSVDGNLYFHPDNDYFKEKN